MNGIDRELLLWANTALASPFMDGLMRAISRDTYWYPVLGAVAVWLVWKHGRLGATAVAAMVLAVVVIDPILGLGVKPLVGRLRPCHELGDLLRLTAPCRESWSFPSNHAANAAALAAALGWFGPRTLAFGVPAALAVGFSRIYLGVHYPSDVVAGLALGALGGIGIAALVSRLTHDWVKRADET